MADTVKVEFARPYTDWSDKNHKPDASASLSVTEAEHVVRLGYARLVTDEAIVEPAKKG